MNEDVVVIGDLPGADTQSGAVTIAEGSDTALPKHAVQNDDGSVTLPLFVPVTLAWKKAGEIEKKDVYSELVLRRLVGKDLNQLASAAKDETGPKTIALSARIPFAIFRHVYDRMDGADISAALKVVGIFLESGPTTGQ